MNLLLVNVVTIMNDHGCRKLCGSNALWDPDVPVQGGSIKVTVNLKMYWKNIPVSGVCVTRDSFAGRLTLLL